MHKDELYMQRCIQLAKLGIGKVAPNPLVGAVIVYKDSIISEGYHQKFGDAHAEVNAISNIPKEHSTHLGECTIYVTLEPCSHFGKTPPCSDLLIKTGFKRVVIGVQDPHEKVSGKGIQKIRDNGIEVTVGVLENECKELIKHFITYHTKNRPFVLLKWAQSKNGYIDRGENNGEVSWISSKETKAFTHALRNEYQSILVGRKTVENDNPSLTTRLITGSNPMRIIIDPELKLSLDKNVFDNSSKTIVINRVKDQINETIHFKTLNPISPEGILELLHKESIQSVLIEGGRSTLQSFIDAKLWDEAIIIEGDTTIQTGTKAPVIDQIPSDRKKHFTDTIITYCNK